MKKFLKLLNIIKLGQLSKLLKYKVAAGVEHYKVLLSLDCMHVIDVGANRGQFALISRKCFPQARIDSFEPLQGPGDQFQSLFAMDKLVKLHRYAIGAENGDAVIHISSKDDSSSLLPISEQQSTLFPGTAESGTESIRVSVLKDVIAKDEIKQPAMLKIDVQGFELEVLYGCDDLLEEIRYIYVECSFVELYEGQAFANEVISFLIKRNFSLIGVYNSCYDSDGIAVQADFLFVSQKN